MLPLVSHTLLETWRRRQGTTLSLAGYQAAGGLDGALTQSAEAFYTALTEHQQRLARELFLRLTAGWARAPRTPSVAFRAANSTRPPTPRPLWTVRPVLGCSPWTVAMWRSPTRC